MKNEKKNYTKYPRTAAFKFNSVHKDFSKPTLIGNRVEMTIILIDVGLDIEYKRVTRTDKGSFCMLINW